MYIRLIVEMGPDVFKTFRHIEEHDGFGPPEYVEFWLFADELLKHPSRIEVDSVRPYTGWCTGGGGYDLPTLLLTFSAGVGGAAATAFVQILLQYLRRNENREIIIEREGAKLSLKGRDALEESEIIRLVFPDLATPLKIESSVMKQTESRTDDDV